MKIFWFSFICQILVAASAMIATLTVPDRSIESIAIIVSVSVIAVFVSALTATQFINAGIKYSETGLSNTPVNSRSPILEFGVLRDRVAEQTHRWHNALAQQRQHLHQFKVLLQRIDDRTISGNETFAEVAAGLRSVLARISRDCSNELALVHRECDFHHQLIAEVDTLSDSQLKTLQRVLAIFNQTGQRSEELHQRSTQSRSELRRWFETVDAIQQDQSATGELVEKMQVQLDQVDRRLRRLNERTRDLDSAVSNISSIAERTDLLSLNASIESSKGGESGRGFSFLAEEVRRLADQASRSSRDLGTLLQSVRSESQDLIDILGAHRESIQKIMAATNSAEGRLQQLTQDTHSRGQELKTIEELADRQCQQNNPMHELLLEISEHEQAQKRSIDQCSWKINNLQKTVSNVVSQFHSLNMDRPSSPDTPPESGMPSETESLLESVALQSGSVRNLTSEEMSR